jgi:ferredoxin
MKRSDFFSNAFKYTIGKAARLLEDNPILKSLENYAEEKTWKRPPGAPTEDLVFQATCTGCDACMIACPFNVIMIEDPESRRPILLPEDPCRNCPDTPCIKACPTGALSEIIIG